MALPTGLWAGYSQAGDFLFAGRARQLAGGEEAGFSARRFNGRENEASAVDFVLHFVGCIFDLVPGVFDVIAQVLRLVTGCETQAHQSDHQHHKQLLHFDSSFKRVGFSMPSAMPDPWDKCRFRTKPRKLR
jgi:hypothetical protein